MSIIDEHTGECLTSLVERSVTAGALIDELDRLALTRGYPAVLRCDNGPELPCDAMADWAGEHVGLSFIPPGEPWRNGSLESFNGRVRDSQGELHAAESLRGLPRAAPRRGPPTERPPRSVIVRDLRLSPMCRLENGGSGFFARHIVMRAGASRLSCHPTNPGLFC